MKRVLAFCFFAAGAFLPAAAGPAASPVTELYGGHTTFRLDFDGGDAAPSVGGVAPHGDPLVADGGMFGSKGLVGGHARFATGKGSKVFDTTRPGTLVFWLKLTGKPDDQSGFEPGETFFSAQWTPRKRVLVFKQGNLKWGTATVDAFYESMRADGRRVTDRIGCGAGSMKTWNLGGWHMCAMTVTQDSLAFSWDGAPFRKTVLKESPGPFGGTLGFGIGRRDGGPGHYVMDECTLLDFALSDDQVRELHDEYRAMMGESAKHVEAPRAVLTRCGPAASGGKWELAVDVVNPGRKSRKLVFDLAARPARSQPVRQRKTFTLAAGETRTFTASGPALDGEKIAADVSVTSANGRYVCFKRRRVFSTDTEEPEWMRAPSPVVFKFAYYPSASTIHALCDIRYCDGGAAAEKVRLSIRRKGGAVVAMRTFPAGTGGRSELYWRGLPELDGEYVCRMEVPGVAGAAAEQTFLRRRFPWEGNRLGKSGAVPAPFTPVKRRTVGGERRVDVLLREHVVDGLGLWKQVTAAGKDLLAAPMRLESDRPLPPVSAESEWDVDGMMLWRLTLPKGDYGTVKLVIPLKKERATLFHPVNHGLRHNFAGAVPAGEGKVWDSFTKCRNATSARYFPYVWVGGPLRGIAVFGENDRGWVVDERVPCQEIVRRGDAVELVLNLVQKPVSLAAARVVKLGFQATPVKPMPDNWRALGHGTLLGACYYWGGFWDSHSVEPFDGTDEFFRVMGESRRTRVFDKAYLERSVAAYPYPYAKGSAADTEHRRRILAHYRNGLWNAANNTNRFVFYTNARGVHYGDPKGQGATFCNEWSRWEYMDRNFDITSRKAYDLDPVASYRDYAAYWYERMLSTGAADHLYWDDVFCQECYNPVQTDAYRLADGRLRPSSGIFNMRALIRRCAVLQTELRKDARGNWVHMTNTALAPVLAFAGVNYDWEDSSGRDPMQVKYPKDYILAATIGRQFGNRVGIMGYFDFSLDRTGAEYGWLERTGAGVMLAHELRWNPGHAPYDKAHAALTRWGYRTARVKVWNYWDEDVAFPVDVRGGDMASLALARGDGEAVVVVSSFEPRACAVSVAPDAAAMGLSAGFKAFDMESGAPIAVARGAVRFTLPRYDFRMIRFVK